MIETAARDRFEQAAMTGTGDAGALARGLRHEVTKIGLRALAAKLLHVAVAAPVRMEEIYDEAANGWLRGALIGAQLRAPEPLAPSGAFWRVFWQLLEIPPFQRERASFTADTIRLAALLGPRLNTHASAAALAAPGVERATQAAGPAPDLEVDSLAAYGPSTLGGAVRLELAARGMDVGFIDLDALGLRSLPSPLEFVNAQALTYHAVWAVLAGYSRAQLDELALAAFQMGQFRHHHSALILGLTMATVAFDPPPGVELVLDSIFKGWAHGRQTPLLLGQDWTDLMPLPLEAARQALGVRPFPSPLQAAMRRLAARR